MVKKRFAYHRKWKQIDERKLRRFITLDTHHTLNVTWNVLIAESLVICTRFSFIFFFSKNGNIDITA